MIIFDLVGMQNEQPYNFTWHAFRNFDFQGKYIPNDLPARGFPISELNDPKFKNYAYAKNMVLVRYLLRILILPPFVPQFESQDMFLKHFAP